MTAVELSERLRLYLAERERVSLEDGAATRCAVLVPLIPAADGYRVLYTLRSQDVPDHRGQVAFPGGKHAPSDPALIDTALREAREEVGIEPRDVHVLGRLDDVITMAARYIVTPYVGLIPPDTRFRPNPHEVADVFAVRLSDLQDPQFHEVERRSWADSTYEVDIITAGAHTIWGVTHRITQNLLACVEDLAVEYARR